MVSRALIMEKLQPGGARPTGERSDAGWVKCAGCGWLVYTKRLARNLHVCPECGYHRRLTARQRIAQLADAGTFRELATDAGGDDPLQFSDRIPYRQRLADAMDRTGEREAAVVGFARIDGVPVLLLVMDFGFLGGSMGTGVGQTVARAAEASLRHRRPLVLVCASGGARMQEGALSLLQMARTSQALARLHEAGVLSVSVLTDPTFGGVTASFAMLGGIVVAESGALVGFAGPRVIEQTIRQRLPEGFQTAEFLLEHGLVDRVESRAGLRPLLARLLRLHTGTGRRHSTQHPPSAGQLAPHDPSPPAPAARDPWDVVGIARHLHRPTALDYLGTVFEDFCELHGDRCFGDDPAIVGGPARLAGRSVMVIAHQKGHDTKELVARNFGMPHPEGYRKALRLMDHAERYGLPVVTLVDTPGAYPGIEAEERGQSGAIAQVIMRSSRLRVPVVSVVTGEGGSGGALALAVGDRLLVLENAFYSVISPEGCAAILWRTPGAAPAAARALRITAPDLVDLGIADSIVAEPAGGAHADAPAAGMNLRRALVDALDDVCGLDPVELLAQRYRRFESIGANPADSEARIA
jgi:acetyl-CoA carboxylase carboxyl transferase alpha subunit/acetyl-CoA carboxylase carboxyl transferase beta subunit